MAGPEDLKDFPELVPGYIGPQVIGPQSARRSEDDDAVLRYYLDPHAARGSRWITGANHLNQHVFNLVYGRDFEADGFIEAAEVRAGDEAPDGSGPLEIARGIEIGHIFQLGRKYATRRWISPYLIRTARARSSRWVLMALASPAYWLL